MKARIEKILEQSDKSFVCQDFKLPVFDCPFHYHPEIELTYIGSSHGERVVGDHVDSFKAGDLVLLGPNLPHMYYNNPGDSTSSKWAHSIVIQFREDAFGESFFEINEMKAIKKLLDNASRGIQFNDDTGRKASGIMKSMLNASGASLVTMLVDLLDMLAHTDQEPLASSHYNGSLNDKQSNRINQIIKYIHNNYKDDVTLSDTAKAIHMAPQSLSRFFRQTTGKTFVSFLNEVRIGNACRLLQQTDLTVVEICFRSGYSNLSNFNRRFKALKKATPEAYRKHFK